MAPDPDWSCNITSGCSSSPPPPFPFPPITVVPGPTHTHSRATNILLLSASLVAALLLSLIIFVVLRRRSRRPGLAAVPAALAHDDVPDAFGGDDGDVHHVWYIRTVGLDEATIESIAAVEYRAGAGLLGTSDCSVCLGEFCDGELVRLLPKCGHAFHVPCIDTWLRAHVNCPVCRALVSDPAAAGQVGVDLSPSDLIVQPGSSSDSSLSGGGEEEQEAEIGSVVELAVDQLGSPDSPSEAPDQGSISDPGSTTPHCVRRWASMDLPLVPVNSAGTEPEETRRENGKEASSQEGQSRKEKQGNPSKGTNCTHVDQPDFERSSSGSGRGFFFSRHGRTRSSILPV